MILTVNVSNSNILLGAYQDDKQCFCSSMHTNLLKSADEYAVQFGSVLSLYGAQPEDISGVILSCVVPSMLACVRKALNHLYTGRIYVAGPGLKTGLSIRTDDPSSSGRLSASLRYYLYGHRRFHHGSGQPGRTAGRGHSAGCKDWR